MYGIHVMARVPAGKMLVAQGTALNSADAFQIDIEGRQAHGAMPWTGVDATLTAAQTVVALQQIVSRNVNLTQGMGVITVGKLQAGETGNVMAGSASMLARFEQTTMPSAANFWSAFLRLLTVRQKQLVLWQGQNSLKSIRLPSTIRRWLAVLQRN